MTAFDDMLDDLFADDNFTVAAVYTPPGGGAGTPCRVAVRHADRDVSLGESRAIANAVQLDVRASEVAPVRGGVFTPALPATTFPDGAASYTVVGDPQRNDADKLVWTCTVR